MKEEVIEVKDLCKTYMNDGQGTNVIKNMNFSIYENEFVVIMGPSGSGKSTLLYLLSGMEVITSGDVYFQKKNICKFKEKDIVQFRRKDIGFVFQAINLVPNVSLFENILIPGYLANKNKKTVDDRALELLDIVEMTEHKEKLPAMVSGGQQQRAAVARALVNSPKVLFADEPTGALNSSQSCNVLDVFTTLNEKGQTIVMVTHDVKAAARAERLLFIKDGRVEGDLSLGKYKKEEADKREKVIFNYLSEKGW